MANLKQENVKRFIEDISKDVAKNAYEGGGSGGGSEMITIRQFAEYVDEKHLSVDALLDLLVAKGIIPSKDPDTELPTFFIGDYMSSISNGQNIKSIVGIYYDSENYLAFFGDHSSEYFELTRVSDLISQKENIEACKMIYHGDSGELTNFVNVDDQLPIKDIGSNTFSYADSYVILTILTYGENNIPYCYPITVTELKSLFVE